MSVIVWILVAVALVAVVAYLLSRKPALPSPEEDKRLPGVPEKPSEPSEKPAEAAPTHTETTARATSVPSTATATPARTETAPEKDAHAPLESVPKPTLEPLAAPTQPAPAEATAAPPPEPVAASSTSVPPALAPPAARGLDAVRAPSREDRARNVAAFEKGLAQTRTGWMRRLFEVFTGKKEIDPALLDAIEETLLTGDVGAATTKRLIDGLKARLDRKELADPERVWEALKADSLAILDVGAGPFGGATRTKPLVILMAGVNGAGKTTTIAKLATRYKEEGRTVLLAAGDTFRAAAVAQLEMWGKRVGVPVHKGKEGAKPSAVVFEAVKRGVEEGFDVVIADTAGRLQTKAPLMEELRKIRDACGKALAGAPHEVLLVLDATTGQNAIVQAEEFSKALALTGVVLTKLDGTAKGGVILAVTEAFKIPVRFVGVGEKSDDLREFDARDFVEALFARSDDASSS